MCADAAFARVFCVATNSRFHRNLNLCVRPRPPLAASRAVCYDVYRLRHFFNSDLSSFLCPLLKSPPTLFFVLVGFVQRPLLRNAQLPDYPFCFQLISLGSFLGLELMYSQLLLQIYEYVSFRNPVCKNTIL